MTKRITKSNVLPFLKTGSRSGSSDQDLLSLAQDRVYQAWQSEGKKRKKLANAALAISPDCSDAYLLLAESENDGKKEIALLRKAVAAAERTLGENWRERFKGHCWLIHETRPLMRAMEQLAIALQWEDELSEALSVYQELMVLNPHDSQGIRYRLAGCLFETHADEQLEALLAANSEDPRASFRYLKALYLFRKNGASERSAEILLDAYRKNCYVPMFLSDLVEMPAEPPEYISIGDELEAIAYVLECGYMWFDTEGAASWMAEVLEPHLLTDFDDKELMEDVILSLKDDFAEIDRREELRSKTTSD